MSDTAFLGVKLRVWWHHWEGVCWLLLLSLAMFTTGYSVSNFVTREKLHDTLVESAMQVEESNVQAREAMQSTIISEVRKPSAPKR